MPKKTGDYAASFTAPKTVDTMQLVGTASTVLQCHEALKALNRLLFFARRGRAMDCFELYCVLDLIEQSLYTVCDDLAPLTGIKPTQG